MKTFDSKEYLKTLKDHDLSNGILIKTGLYLPAEGAKIFLNILRLTETLNAEIIPATERLLEIRTISHGEEERNKAALHNKAREHFKSGLPGLPIFKPSEHALELTEGSTTWRLRLYTLESYLICESWGRKYHYSYSSTPEKTMAAKNSA